MVSSIWGAPGIMSDVVMSTYAEKVRFADAH
jgi:hypothetical protein